MSPRTAHDRNQGSVTEYAPLAEWEYLSCEQTTSCASSAQLLCALCGLALPREGRLVLPVGLKWLREAETIRRPDIKIERVLHLSTDRDIIIIVRAGTVSRGTGLGARPERVT